METQAQYTSRMLKTHPRQGAAEQMPLIVRCIDACLSCAQACVACSDACLAEERLENLRRCIRLDLDCADICETTARVLSRQSELDANVAHLLLQTCEAICRACAEECVSHSEHMEHCAICAEACRSCASSCFDLINARLH